MQLASPTDWLDPASGETRVVAQALLAAGCFWGVEARLRALPGVLDAEVGYSGGHVPDPGYRRVCSGDTGRAEVVRVWFDPQRLSYADLLRAFFALHDPTQRNRQGPDIGTQYRSAIFTLNDAQRQEAETVKAALQSSGRWSRPIVTEITPARAFWRAEEYHQRYLDKHGRGVCHF